MKNPFLKPKRVLESAIEKYLKQEVERLRGVCRKVVSPGHNGMPDRVVILPGRGLFWVELKQAKGIVSALQEREHEMLRNLGQRVVIIRSKEEAKGFLFEVYD